MSKETGGPAFPTKASVGGGSSLDSNGMTLRDYFAAKAMQGFASNHENNAWAWDDFAKYAYVVADAMLKERNKC